LPVSTAASALLFATSTKFNEKEERGRDSLACVGLGQKGK